MNDKRFLKAKKVGEERCFRNERELRRFCEKQEDITLDKALGCDILTRNQCEWTRIHFPNSCYEKERELFASGGFLFRAFYISPVRKFYPPSVPLSRRLPDLKRIAS